MGDARRCCRSTKRGLQLRVFPDRFVIGSDQFYDSPPVRCERARKFVDWLPPDLAPLISYENLRRIYRLAGAGH